MSVAANWTARRRPKENAAEHLHRGTSRNGSPDNGQSSSQLVFRARDFHGRSYSSFYFSHLKRICNSSIGSVNSGDDALSRLPVAAFALGTRTVGKRRSAHGS